tara:strand:+ start:1493 stop:1681 length:189 start_codon:yes stop_codon:yes gene_type:complete
LKRNFKQAPEKVEEVINPTTKVKLSIQLLITDRLDQKLKERAQLIKFCPSKAKARPEDKKKI